MMTKLSHGNTPRSHGEDDDGRQGFALLLVIWILALLAVLAAGVAADSQSESKIARNRLELARAREAAQAGISLATANLTVPDVSQRWRADGALHTIRYDAGTVVVTIQDEGGKIDINRAPLELIASLFDTLDPSTKESRDVVMNAIAQQRQLALDRARATDPRTNYDLPRRRRGNAFTEGAFATISELRQLNGMSRTTFERIRPFITTYSQNPTINPLTAPREVLAALPGVNGPTIDLYIIARQSQGIGQAMAALPSLGTAATGYISTADLTAATITAKATTDTGISFTREAVVSFDSTEGLPIKFVEWRQAVDADIALSDAGQ